MGATLGITRDDAARLLDAAQTCLRLGKAPLPSSVCSVEPSYPLEDVEALFGQEWFRALAAERGIDLSVQQQVSARQLAALAIYVDPGVKAGHARRLQLAGVPSSVWDAWMLNPRFAQRLADASEDRLRAITPVAVQRLAEAADRGEKWAIELVLEMSGRHDRRDGATDLPGLFRAILSVLDEKVAPLPGGEGVVLEIAERMANVADGSRRAPAAIASR